MGHRSLIKRMYFAFLGIKCIAKTLSRGNRAHNDQVLKNKDVLLLGNGPSLSELNIYQLRDKMKICCVNFFPIKNPEFFKIRPEYYCCVDPELFKKGAVYKNEINRLFETLNRVDWKMVIITRQGADLPVRNENLVIEYLSSCHFETDYSYRMAVFLFQKNYAVYGMANVVSTAAFYFVLKGVSNLYLAGIDMNALTSIRVDVRNHAVLDHEHFYKEQPVDLTERGDVKKGELYRFIDRYISTFRDFMQLKIFADVSGSRIYNLTPGSWVDCFKKADWKSLVQTDEDL